MNTRDNLIFTGTEVLLNMIDRQAKAAAILRKAHEEGRDASSEELASVRAEGAALLTDLDQAIAHARANGR